MLGLDTQQNQRESLTECQLRTGCRSESGEDSDAAPQNTRRCVLSQNAQSGTTQTQASTRCPAFRVSDPKAKTLDWIGSPAHIIALMLKVHSSYFV